MFVKQGLRLVYSGSVTQANMKLASIGAGAMIDIGVDWSAYAGNDAGSTPHMLVLYDSAGKRLQGFIGASGGGLAYGSNLAPTACCTDPDNDQNVTTGWSPRASAVLSSEVGGDTGFCLKVLENGANSPYALKESTSSVVGGLYQYTGKINSGGSEATYRIKFLEQDWGAIWDSSSLEATNDWVTTWEGFACIPIGTTGIKCMIQQICDTGAGTYILFDNVYFRQVTDISTNGVHLHSTKGGTNRNVASIDIAFDLNCSAGYTFKIYSCQ